MKGIFIAKLICPCILLVSNVPKVWFNLSDMKSTFVIMMIIALLLETAVAWRNGACLELLR